jgi:hypothetical protein
VTLLDGEDAQIHSADKFPMSRGNSCPRFCHGYGADTRFGLRSRRLAPRICVYCKQSNANNPLQTIQCKQSTANNLMQTIQLSSRAQRGIPVVIPSAAEGSRLSSRVQPRDLGCHPERSGGISVSSARLRLRQGILTTHPDRRSTTLAKTTTNRACPRKLGYVPSVARFPVPRFQIVIPSAAEESRLSSPAQRGIPVSWARLRLRQGILTAHPDRRFTPRARKDE